MSGAKNYKSKEQLEDERKRKIAIEEEKKRIKQVLEQNRLIALEKERLRKIQLEKEKSEREEFLKNISEDVHIVEKNTISSKEQDYLERITLTLEYIKMYDSELYEFKKDQRDQLKDTASQKAKLFLDDIRLQYEKVKSNYIWTKIYKESIKELLQQLSMTNTNDLCLKNDIEKILTLQLINEKIYDDIFDRIQNELEAQKEKVSLVTQIITSLEELNYVVITDKEQLATKLLNKEKVILPVNNQVYQVAIALNKDSSILTRFIKTVSSQKDVENISTSDRLQDNENLKKWCSLQITFQESLKSAGIDTIQEIVEDEESDILYIVDSSSKKSSIHQASIEIGKL